MLYWRVALRRMYPILGGVIVFLTAGVVGGAIYITGQSFTAESMASFRGTTQGVFFHAVTTKSSEFWSLGDAYLCIPPTKLPPPFEMLIQRSAGERLCDEGSSTKFRKAVPLGGNVSVSFEKPTGVAVRVHTLQGNSSYLVINGTNPPEETPECNSVSEGQPTVRTSLPGAEKFALPLLVELRVAITKPVVLPYSGLITVGGRVADDQGFLLNAGTGAIYLEDGNDLHLVKQTEIFPGDTVRFASKAGCEIPSTGFVRLDRYGDIDSLQVISSARAAGAKVSVERIGTRSDAEGTGRRGEISVEASQLDRLLNSGGLALLGAGITALVLCVELYSVVGEYLTKHSRTLAECISGPVALTGLPNNVLADEGRGGVRDITELASDQKPDSIQT